ncbi:MULTISPECIES: hypothetical protein [Flavobacteriaceae]|uniref:hypothetical protein n=1 Tax=Flavobacteriaceae TaxID=49546 RepID=UPI002349CF09|nr:hypothetical protein [Muricauda sp. SP22]MDC6364052.1 hypothetical protein [Muricauda sp. SP22]
MKPIIFVFASLVLFWNYENSPTDSNLEGFWTNENTEAPGITKCNIRYEDNRFYVQIWGKCRPTDCDWGENASNEISNETDELKLTWKNEFVERNQTLELIEGKLIITTENHYKDGRPKNSFSETFVKK